MKLYTRILTLLILFSMLAQVADACSVCFKDPNSSMTSGLKQAVFVLLGALFIVFGAFIKFLWGFKKRSQLLNL